MTLIIFPVSLHSHWKNQLTWIELSTFCTFSTIFLLLVDAKHHISDQRTHYRVLSAFLLVQFWYNFFFWWKITLIFCLHHMFTIAEIRTFPWCRHMYGIYLNGEVARLFERQAKTLCLAVLLWDTELQRKRSQGGTCTQHAEHFSRTSEEWNLVVSFRRSVHMKWVLVWVSQLSSIRLSLIYKVRKRLKFRETPQKEKYIHRNCELPG